MEIKEIEKLKDVDVRTVDVSELTDIDEIEINSELSKDERCLDFARKVKNPFCFICNGMIVKISYANTEERLENKLLKLCFEMEKEQI